LSTPRLSHCLDAYHSAFSSACAELQRSSGASSALVIVPRAQFREDAANYAISAALQVKLMQKKDDLTASDIDDVAALAEAAFGLK